MPKLSVTGLLSTGSFPSARRHPAGVKKRNLPSRTESDTTSNIHCNITNAKTSTIVHRTPTAQPAGPSKKTNNNLIFLEEWNRPKKNNSVRWKLRWQQSTSREKIELRQTNENSFSTRLSISRGKKNKIQIWSEYSAVLPSGNVENPSEKKPGQVDCSTGADVLNLVLVYLKSIGRHHLWRHLSLWLASEKAQEKSIQPEFIT